MTRPWVPWLLLTLAVGALALSHRGSDAPDSMEPVIRYLVPEELQGVARAALIENEGLRARLEGVRELVPDTVLVTDTLVAPPDTVIRTVTIRDGEIRWTPLFRADTLYAPEVRVATFGDCDDGLEVRGGRIICDPAVLGHLYVHARAGSAYPWADAVPRPLAAIGLEWTPSYRSPWSVYASIDIWGASAWVERRWQVF